MKKVIVLVTLMSSFLVGKAQEDEQPQDTSWKQLYRASAPRINDLVHTKLEVSFDYNKSWMYGKEWVTLHPHFYPTDSLTLDAKGMEIKEISLMKGNIKSALKYNYDGMQLKINLGKTYKAAEKYTIFIDYISKPDELKAEGSEAITDAKGLYFINPRGEDKDKAIQIWTQGETEANSAWFPTIDKPNQKTTEEISMTVPSKYVTLSNGRLISQKTNSNGTRTDYWKMDLPHSPYLFFMGVGDYAIIKDKHNNIPVNYYVEKEYASVAKKIFGETPRMIGLYEKLTGIPYPWPKYDQIVGRDYVSGAMENTTATLHQESAYQNARQLVDGNGWEEVIAHELFHQWFGDFVTTESWSNITLNESFADYSETLWDEFRYGKDAGDEHIEENRQTYL
ncbi:MAG: M1 family metallopeptidase, partial [Ginsengibacter sp.]